jgi:very-short-patch-repair endonuclease
MSVFGSEVDIFLPEVGFAIEIDGVSHHQPVWGEEVLQKTQLADSKKNGELLNNGISVVRVRNEKSTFAQIHVIKVADYLDKLIEQGRFKNQLVRVDLNEL